MKYYLYSATLILLAIISVTFIPITVDYTENYLINFQIPLNNSQVAGVQKYNSPPVSKNTPVPNLSAKAILVKDLSGDSVLYEKESNIPLPIASTTKIMTALVASEYFKPTDILTVKDGASVPGAKVGLFQGESLNFKALLYGMLLNSGNDAAYTLAENYEGGYLGFVSAMNKKAYDLKLSNTHFDNPAGFDSSKHYSSASDLAKLTEEALKNYQLAKIFATKETNIFSVDKKYKHELHNLNKLLTQVVGVLGVKTGFTKEAKENLITLVERDGHKVLLVILGSDDRFGESTKLIDWTYQNFQWSD